ncbi:mechanosensitive ion channel domain-containing protein [Algoriphagus pacificus]|uniref:Mechanosensitive ion channel n=1 Tax=Algoriphagus pacificus TaxID=2811234 RepID=A0ABS3CKH5_9BACT|nr:mechanosensitive ion channel domain-containing protein [Algoriphagus pacificus]MBN7816986.1 mechanosensitive ion channel [Algoriphagus pacificus]
MDPFNQAFRNFCGSFIIIFLFIPALSNAARVIQNQNEIEKESVGSEKLTDIEFLVELSQRIIQDKSRLISLKSDSTRQEPIFQNTAVQFYQIDNYLDSIKKMESPPVDLAFQVQEWEKLKEGLEFMLQRRRNLNQQIKIVKSKIEKEEEIFALSMKGNSSIIMDLLERGSNQFISKNISNLDSLKSDSTFFNKEISINEVDNEYNWRIVEAERELKLLKAKFDVAKIRWLLLEQLSTINQDDLDLMESFSFNSQKQLAHWKSTIKQLEVQLKELQKSNSNPRLQSVIANRIAQSYGFIGKVDSLIAKDDGQITQIESRVSNLNSLKSSMTNEVADATRKILTQNRWLEYLRSPLAPHRIISFLVNTGPRILIILLMLFMIWLGGKWIIGHILRGLTFRGYKTKEDREERFETLSRAIRSGLSIAVIFIGFLTVLSELGINVSVLLGGAAVFSLAIAFGAQSLVKDFFSGFMILSENQYRVGNVIKIDNISGVVEDISLRTTVLRDLEGVAHFIPHGEITKVSNLTHKWSRVSLEIGIAYKENIDHVMDVIVKVAKGMRNDNEYKNLITDEPEMLGVDSFADSAIIIKVLLKTKPMKQWLVKREFLRRLKNRFDELNIEIPFPHRTIYHRDLPNQD